MHLVFRFFIIIILSMIPTDKIGQLWNGALPETPSMKNITAKFDNYATLLKPNNEGSEFWKESLSNPFTYPTADPHPTGALQASDENFVVTTLFTTAGQISKLKSTIYYTSLQVFNDNAYFVYCDTNRRPKLVKANEAGSTEAFLDSNPDYTIRADSHFEFSLGIDREGYIHVSGDMHNHYPGSTTSKAKVPRYRNSNIMYWVSDQPEDINAFTFQGGSGSTQRPDGYCWTYQRFFTDMNGQLFLKARNYVHENGHQEGELGLGLYRYNENTKTWTTLGALPPTTHGNVATHKVIFWEDNGEWWQSKPKDYYKAFYQGLYPGIRVDRENALHFCFSINNVSGNKQGTDVIYWKSTDGGNTFQRADGTAISAPVRGSRSTDAGDVIYTGRSFALCWVDVDWAGNPIVTYSYAVNQEAQGVVVPPSTRIYRNGIWENPIQIPFNCTYGSGLGTGNDLILNYVAANNSQSGIKLYRTRRYGESGYGIALGGYISGFDWKHFAKTNELYLVVNDKTNQMVKKIAF